MVGGVTDVIVGGVVRPRHVESPDGAGDGAGDGSGEILEGVPNVALLGGAALAALLLLK